MHQCFAAENVIKLSGGNIGDDHGIKAMIFGTRNKATMTPVKKKTLSEDVEQQIVATAFILCADCLRFGKLIEHMENSYHQGNNKYPAMIVSAAYHLLSNWKQDPRHGLREVGGGEISFVNDYDKKGKAEDKKTSLVTDARKRYTMQTSATTNELQMKIQSARTRKGERLKPG
jgi:hypothetical protein